MFKPKYFFAKVKDKIMGTNKHTLNYFRKRNIEIGAGCYIYSNIVPSEPFLLKIGNNVTVSNDVQFITHDNAICKVKPEYSDIFGTITIGDNCFIGARSTILLGVELAHNIIVGAGSVVTKSFDEERIIIAGNPARKICSFDDYINKYGHMALNVHGYTKEEKYKTLIKNKEKLINK
jgi:acetyltransferase-like isoleucine patch superfamily enzyme